tara:strand:- start:518 stop:1285 length:768 start_codon:yes stop_codon:yes gene_type:complete
MKNEIDRDDHLYTYLAFKEDQDARTRGENPDYHPVILNERQSKYLPEFGDNIIKGMMKYITSDSVMFEYGSGGSTFYFPKFVKKFYSVEFITKFHEKIEYELKENFSYDNVYYYCKEPNQFAGDKVLDAYLSDITDSDYQRLKEKYPHHTEHTIKRYWQFRDHVDFIYSIKPEKIDVALVDGRARGMCATRVAEFMDENGVIFIDDFMDRHNEYFGPTEQEDFYKMFEHVETLHDDSDPLGRRGSARMIVLRKKS